MIKEFKQLFGAGINLDLDDLAMQVGQTREIHNLRYDNFNSSNKGALSTFKGMQLLPNRVPLPTGVNTVIGAKAYYEENGIIFFVHNSDGYHSIRFLNESGEVITILQQGYRGATLDVKAWHYDLNFFEGARITHINIIGDLLFWVNPSNEPNRINIKRAIYFNNKMPEGYLLIDAAACKAAKAPPILPPIATYATDLKHSFSNLLRGNNYQFRYSYVYVDADLSTTSPISAASFASGDFDVFGGSNPQAKKNNVLNVSVATGGPEVKFIRVYVQVNNLGNWTLFKEIDKKKEVVADYSTKAVKFYGTELGYAVDQNYVNRLYSRVPILSRAQEFIDNKYLLYGGNVEGRGYLTSKQVSYNLHAEKIELQQGNGEPNVRNMPLSAYDVPSRQIGDIDPDPVGGDDPPGSGDGVFVTVYPPAANLYAIGNQIYIHILRDKDGASIEINDLYVTEGNQATLPNAMAQKINMAATWLTARVAALGSAQGVAIWAQYGAVITVTAQEIGFITTGFVSATAVGGVKLGASTAIGIAYSDEDGRLSGTNEIAELNIPWYHELKPLAQGQLWNESEPGRMVGILDDEYRYRIMVDLAITHKPPLWAHAMHIVATRPMQIGAYFQTRVKFTKVTGKPWVLMNLSEYNKKANKNSFGNSNLRAYIFNQGDRVRLISYGTNLINRTSRYIEAEIIGFETNQDGSLNADQVRVSGNEIAGIVTSTELKAMVEIYSPTPYGDVRLYKEIMSLPIVNAGSVNALHTGNVENQTTIEPAKITIDMINCFHHARQFWENSEIGMVEDTTYCDFAKSIDATGMGRVSVYDKSINEEYRNSLIYSEAYFDNTNINGLAMFPPDGRYKALSDEKGNITALRFTGNTLVVVMERDNQSIYIGKAGLAQAQSEGREIVVSTEQVLSSTYPSMGDYGTTYPESVVMVGRNMYFFDLAHSAIIRRSANGLDAISDMYGIRKDMTEITRALKLNYNTRVIAGYNRKYDEVYFTFIAKSITGSVVLNKTWVFGTASEDRNEFKYNIDLSDILGNAPECFVNNGDAFYSFIKGSVWLHEATDQVNLIYGVLKPYSVKFVVNPEPDTIKTFDTIALVTNKRWDVLAEVKPTENTPFGMESILGAKELVAEEGGFFGAIHGNSISQFNGSKSVYHSINGELLRGSAMSLTLSGKSATPVYLIVIKVGYSYSGVS